MGPIAKAVSIAIHNEQDQFWTQYGVFRNHESLYRPHVRNQIAAGEAANPSGCTLRDKVVMELCTKGGRIFQDWT